MGVLATIVDYLIVTTEGGLAERNIIFRERLDTEKSSMKDECRKLGLGW